MSAVLLAVFDEYPQADRVRTQLVKDGFPTDRVELTAAQDPGRAAEQPAHSHRAKFEQYFRTLLKDEHEQSFVDTLIERVAHGAATITVQPRGDIETKRALQLLEGAGASEVVGHDLDNQGMEQAASPDAKPWVRYLSGGADKLVLPSERRGAQRDER
jgi:hypothetical protein